MNLLLTVFDLIPCTGTFVPSYDNLPIVLTIKTDNIIHMYCPTKSGEGSDGGMSGRSGLVRSGGPFEIPLTSFIVQDTDVTKLRNLLSTQYWRSSMSSEVIRAGNRHLKFCDVSIEPLCRCKNFSMQALHSGHREKILRALPPSGNGIITNCWLEDEWEPYFLANLFIRP